MHSTDFFRADIIFSNDNAMWNAFAIAALVVSGL